MTDREPDDLYDALRDRLADYGQEPPAPLWAGIRAQLPSPVAQPRLRPRRRRASVVLLLLLLVTASGLGWRWWHNQPASGGAATARLATVAPTASGSGKINTARTTTPATATSPRPAAPGTALRPSQPAAGVAAGSSTPAGINSKLGAAETDNALNSQPAGRDAASAAARATGATPASQSQAATAVALANGSKPLAARPSKRRPQEAAGDATAAISATFSGPAASRMASPIGYSAGRAIAAHSPEKPCSAGSSAARTLGPNAKKAARQRSNSAPVAAGLLAKRSVERQPSQPSNGPEAGPAARLTLTRIQSAIRPPDGASTTLPSTVALEAATPAISGAAALTAQALAQLQARAVSLQLAAAPALAQPQEVAVAPNAPPAALLPRWAVQVLAGPALTYRQLSGAPALNATAPIALPITAGVQYRPVMASVAELERPALGGGAQILVRCALNARWSLSAGLGYAEYATRLALQQVRSTSAVRFAGQDSTTTSIHRRDTYRFVTLPLRVGYAKPLSPRWSVGLLAGADVAFYVGGSSTEGSACACQSQTWGLTGSPYRRVSVGASLGAEVRYRLNGRWELLAQPTATYMLNPLAQSTSPYYRRQLLGGTALLGAAYTLP